MSLREKPNHPPLPAPDEWGIYDPELTGLPAVWRRLRAKLRASGHSGVVAVARSMRAASLSSKPGLKKSKQE